MLQPIPVPYCFHYTRYRYGTKPYYWYQSIRPLLTMSLRGLLLRYSARDGVRIWILAFFSPEVRNFDELLFQGDVRVCQNLLRHLSGCCLGSSISWINYYYVYFQDCSLRFSVFRGLLWRLITLSST